MKVIPREGFIEVTAPASKVIQEMMSLMREFRMCRSLAEDPSVIETDIFCTGAARYFLVKPINLSKTSSELAVTK